MTYYFIKDYRLRYRFFSSEPQRDVTIKTSRFKKLWELAQKKLLLLPYRMRRQEQAFISVPEERSPEVRVCHSGYRPEKRVHLRFSFFLYKQRSKHVLFLVGETLLLPLSGLAMLLPGPNVFFAALALLMITHWRALRGINRLARKKHDFQAAPLFAEWEEALAQAQEPSFAEILQKIGEEYSLPELNKILWK